MLTDLDRCKEFESSPTSERPSPIVGPQGVKRDLGETIDAWTAYTTYIG